MLHERRSRTDEVSSNEWSLADILFIVRTGKYREGAEKKVEHPPDTVYDTFAAFVDDLV